MLEYWAVIYETIILLGGVISTDRVIIREGG
jgi:hypothetical protein